MAKTITDRMARLGGRTQARLRESRMERIDRENARLKTEVGILRKDLEEDRNALHEALSALGDHEQRVTVEERNGRGRIIGTMLVAGGGYVLGTRAGRARFEQMKGWARAAGDSIRTRIGHDGPDAERWESSAPESVSEADGKVRA